MRTRPLGIGLGVVLATTVLGALAAGASAKTVWLCFPGHRPDPCTPGLSTTVYSPTLKKLGVQHPKQVAHPGIDCFYVYPTVSSQPTGNSNLKIDPEERSVALAQVGRYSQDCRVFAPMYRQVTLDGIVGTSTTKPNVALALSDLRGAFRTYLEKYNNGRGFVLIGHSQGSFMLRQLIAKDVDPKPSVRKHLVSAILMGGNVLVKKGKDVGGDFKHIPACHAATQLGCVIAYSTFDEPVPNASLFGRPLPILGTTVPRGTVVLCTNPAALGGGSGVLDPIFARAGIGQLGPPRSRPTTVWATAPRSYRASCSSANDANVLQIVSLGGAPKPAEILGPAWGLHLLDANIALGNLLSDVKSEAAAFLRGSR